MKIENMLDLLCCPVCHSKLVLNNDGAACKKCNQLFPKKSGGFSFLCEKMYENQEAYDKAIKIIEYWGNGWEKRLKDKEHSFLLKNSKKSLIDDVDRMMEYNSHRKGTGNLWSTEVMNDFQMMNDKVCLNIGCGAGSEAIRLVFKGKVNCIAMDITSQANEITMKAIKVLEGTGIGIQADARYIPLSDNSIDIIYSSGVLHHSENINQSISEVHRVLKPGGVAYIGLYSNTSIHFLKIQLAGLLKGQFNSKARKKHLSNTTETAWRTADRKNPYTKVFGIRECKKLFGSFNNTRIRKGNFIWTHIPKVGRFLDKYSNNPIFRKIETSKFMAFWGTGVYIKAKK